MNIYYQSKNMDLEIMEIERKNKMIEEKIYKYGDYVVSYVSDGWDSGCLTISKIQNDNMYVIGEITGGIAEIIDFILDSVEDEISKYESKLDKIKETINYYAIENEDYSKMYNQEEQKIIKLLEEIK